MPKESKAERLLTVLTGSMETRIVVSARVHFLSHGFRGVTMDDIASELGISKKTLYASFTSKTALLEAVLEAKFADVNRDLEAIATRADLDPRGALNAVLACVQRHTEEIQPAFVRDIRREAPELFKVVEGHRREVIRRHFTEIFGRSRKAGAIRDDIPVEFIIEMLIAAMDGIMNPARMEELRITPATGYSAILTVILEGVLKPAKRKKS